MVASPIGCSVAAHLPGQLGALLVEQRVERARLDRQAVGERLQEPLEAPDQPPRVRLRHHVGPVFELDPQVARPGSAPRCSG